MRHRELKKISYCVIYYCSTGYYSNPKSLLKALKASDACKKEGYQFRLSECKDILEN